MWVTMETNESKVAFICLLILLESPEDGGTIYQLENNGEGGSLCVWGGVSGAECSPTTTSGWKSQAGVWEPLGRHLPLMVCAPH